MATAAITVDLNARIAGFESDLKKATATLDNFGARGNAVAGVMKSAFVGLGAAVSVGALASFAKSGIDAADALNDMSLRLKVSVKDLASFQLIAEQSGTSLEGVGKGIARLTRSMGDAEGGNKQLAAALATLGVTARDPKEAFYQLADAVQKIQDPAQRATLLNKVLGKSYQELIPLLEGGGQALRDSAKASETFSDAMARLAPDADKFNDQLASMKINAAGAAGALLADLVPALNEVFERIGLVKQLIGAGGLFNTLVNTIGTDDPGEVMKRLRNEIALTQQAIDGKTADGRDPSAFAGKLKGLNAQLQVMIAYRTKLDLMPPDTETMRLIKADRAAGMAAAAAKATAKKGGSKSDPLASLLSSTDIGRMEEFEKKVGLLNARFDGGRKSTELYTQAMTKLIETAFSTNFSEFDKQLKDSISAAKEYAAVQAEFERAGAMAAKAAETDAAALAAQVVAQREHNEEIGLSAVALNELEQARFDVSIAALQQFEAERMIAGASNEELAAIWDKIDALKELKQLRGEGAEKQGNFDALKDMNDYLDPAKAQSFGDALSNSFGKAGSAIGKMAGAFDNYAKKQAEFNKKRAALSPEDLIKKETELTKKQAEIQIGAYGDMAGAAKTFFDEGSTGYKVLGAAEQGFRLLQIGMSIAAMAQGATETTASVAQSGTKAVASTAAGAAKAFEQMGVWGFVGAAAIIAFMASMGVKGGGSGSSVSISEQRQKSQGTGTVLGDADAKSESLTNALELLADVNTTTMRYSARMAKSLQNIEVALTGVSSMIFRTPGLTSGNPLGVYEGNLKNPWDSIQQKGTSGVGDPVGDWLLGGLFGKKSQKISDSGLNYKGVLSGIEAGLQTFMDVTTTKKSWFGSKTSTSTTMSDAPDDISRQFGLIFQNVSDSLEAAGGVFGKSADILETQIANIEIDLSTVSLKGLKGDDLKDALNAVISAASDDIARQALPGLEQYIKVGEGYYETAVRVAYSTEYTTATLKRLGMTLGDTADAIVGNAQALLDLSGGVEGLVEKTDYFYDSFFSDAEKLAIATSELQAAFVDMGQALPASQAGFRSLIEAQDLTTDAGRQLYVRLMELAPAFIDVADAAEKARESAVDAAMAATDAAYASLERAVEAQRKIFESAQKVAQDAVNTLTGLFEMLKQNVQDLYGSAAGAAAGGRAYIDQALSTAQSTGNLPDSNDLSKAISSARGGLDATQYATSFELERDRLVLAGKLSQLQDIAGIQKTIAEQQLDAANAQLDALDGVLETARAQIDALRGIDTSVMSVEAAILGLAGAMRAEAALQQQMVTVIGSGAISQSATSASVAAATYSRPASSVDQFVAGQYESILGRTADDVGLDYWANQIKSGALSESDFAAQFKTVATAALDDEARKAAYLATFGSLPQFAVGTNYVPNDMLAQIHEGEAIVPKAYNPAAGGGGGDNQTASEVRQLREENRAQALSIAQLNARMVKLLERWDGAGMPEVRVTA